MSTKVYQVTVAQLVEAVQARMLELNMEPDSCHGLVARWLETTHQVLSVWGPQIKALVAQARAERGLT